MGLLARSLAYPLALTCLGFGTTGCFDSDQVVSAPSPATLPASTDGPADPSTTTTTGRDPSDTSSILTCRGAIVCIRECATAVAVDPDPEPSLDCFADCIEDNLNEQEAYDLLRLSDCASMECEAMGLCNVAPETGTTGGDGSSSSSSSGEARGLALDPCLLCVFGLMENINSGVCEEFHSECR